MIDRTALLLPICLLMAALTGCSTDGRDPVEAVATIRPVALIVEPVTGSDVPELLPAGASPHTHDPRPSDLRAATSASIILYGSPDLDGWAATFDVPRKVALLSFVPESLLVLVTEEHADPHFWMDPLVVRAILPALTDTLCAIASERCAGYREAAAAFAEHLVALHDSINVMMREFEGEPILAAHPFLSYFARRYGLEMAGVVEEIPGSEPTPAGLMRMIEAARSTGARVIFTQPQHSSRVAHAVAEASGMTVVELDPIGGGVDGYADLLYFNASRIQNALATTTSHR